MIPHALKRRSPAPRDVPTQVSPAAAPRPDMLRAMRSLFLPMLACAAAWLGGCARTDRELPRRGDEIVVCGRLFHTGAPVVLWTDPGGYDAYRTEKRFAPWPKSAFAPPAKAGDGP